MEVREAKTEPPTDGSAVSERLAAALRQAQVSFKMTEHAPVFTSQEAADVRGTNLCSGAKALLVKTGEGFVLVVMPADRSLNSGALRKLLGVKRSRFADKDELFRLTGLVPGAVPPFGSLFHLPTICDHSLSDNETINFNAGCNSRSIQMSYADYAAFESPQIADVTKAPKDSEA